MKRCFDCGKELEAVPPSTTLNSYQWDAVKAGDWFAPCAKATHPNGNCYFNETAGLNTLKRKCSKATPEPPAQEKVDE